MLVISSLLGASMAASPNACRGIWEARMARLSKGQLARRRIHRLKSVKDHVWMWFNNEFSGWIVDLSKCVGGIG